MTINNNTGLYESGNWNEYNLNPLTRIHWRASLVNIRHIAVDARDSRADPSGTVMPASRAATDLNGLAAGKMTWYGEG